MGIFYSVLFLGKITDRENWFQMSTKTVQLYCNVVYMGKMMDGEKINGWRISVLISKGVPFST